MPAKYDDLGNYTGYQNDDGTWWSGSGQSSLDPNSTRPDLQAAGTLAARVRMMQLNKDPAYKQFTPEQFDAYMGAGKGQYDYAASQAPFANWGIYNDNVDGTGAKNLWFGPEAGPQHNDTGPEQAQTAWNDMRYGGSILAMPFVGAGITAGVGAGLAAGGGVAAGAGGAAAGGAGVGAAGIDASTGLFAGESATSGAAGAGALEGGAFSGGTGSASLLGDAGSDTAASMPAAVPEADPLGGYSTDPNTGDVFYGSGDNPYGSNFSGGTGNEGFSGYQPGVLEQAQGMATSLAKQFGLTPAAALQMALKGIGRAAPAALGAVAANKQANSLGALSDKYMALGAPSRDRYESSYQPGFTMANEPGYQDALNATTKATLHALSVNGNPAGSPNAWDQTLSDVNSKFAFPALQRYREQNANTGGIGTLTAAAPSAATGAIGARTNVFNALGASANDIFSQPKSLAQQIDEINQLKKAMSGGVQ